MAGRFVWSTTSDVVGRKNMYMVYLGAGMVLYLLLTFVGPSSTLVFALLAGLILSFYGRRFATVPAYLRDPLGTFQVGAIHGRLLTAWSAAGVAGPLIVNGILDTQGEPGSLTSGDYAPALITMVCALAIGFVANLLITPVDPRFHEPEGDDGPTVHADMGDSTLEESPVPVFLLPVAWLVAGIPLAYGVYETVSKAIDLFG